MRGAGYPIVCVIGGLVTQDAGICLSRVLNSAMTRGSKLAQSIAKDVSANRSSMIIEGPGRHRHDYL